MIDTRGAGQGGLGVTVEGPCEAAINCRDNGDATCNVAYLPTEAGDYTVNITFNERHINGSPFQPLIVPVPNLKNTRVSGIGIQPHGRRTSSCQLPVDRCQFRVFLLPYSSNPLRSTHHLTKVACCNRLATPFYCCDVPFVCLN
ncbi:hypothetical protein M5D96_000088 [Drosophila gunungcola]|uniref:Uncharacterized protein n=1 Tax=Drosophila gunungcola TaxID=103775 RepID=A0A9Q0BU25_9MUSC|nr:hypothetical protein M5D96_000088 [Drosophila gunungcola]